MVGCGGGYGFTFSTVVTAAYGFTVRAAAQEIFPLHLVCYLKSSSLNKVY